jgi:thioesterase domain-containing protein
MATLSAQRRASLAAQLRQGRPRNSGAGTAGPVPLNDGPATRRLVVLHAVGGTVFPYGHLASAVADRFAVWGVPAPAEAPESLEQLVTQHLETLRRFWPAGPYRLAGWSMGGILAFELARRLQADGAEVEQLGLLDTPIWLPGDVSPTPAQYTGWFVADAARSLRADVDRPPGLYRAGVDEQLDWLARAMDPTGEPGQLREELAARCAVFCANTKLIAGYRPTGQVRARALVVDVEGSPNGSSGWPDVIDGPTRTRWLPGNHYSFLQPPLVSRLAAELLELDEERQR